MKKTLVIFLALTLCLTLASCSFIADKTNTDSKKISSENLPEEQADIIELYNSCLENTETLKRTEYQRTLLYCNAKMMSRDIDICEFFPDINDAVGINDTTPTENDLTALDASQVKSAALTEKTENTATYKIELNDASSDQTIKSDQDGYWGVLEFEEISELIVSSTAQIGVDGVEVGEEMDINLTEGTLEVVIDLDTQKVISVDGSYKEGGTGKIKYAVVSTNVDLQVEQTMRYSSL